MEHLSFKSLGSNLIIFNFDINTDVPVGQKVSVSIKPFLKKVTVLVLQETRIEISAIDNIPGFRIVVAVDHGVRVATFAKRGVVFQLSTKNIIMILSY